MLSPNTRISINGRPSAVVVSGTEALVVCRWTEELQKASKMKGFTPIRLTFNINAGNRETLVTIKNVPGVNTQVSAALVHIPAGSVGWLSLTHWKGNTGRMIYRWRICDAVTVHSGKMMQAQIDAEQAKKKAAEEKRKEQAVADEAASHVSAADLEKVLAASGARPISKTWGGREVEVLAPAAGNMVVEATLTSCIVVARFAEGSREKAESEGWKLKINAKDVTSTLSHSEKQMHAVEVPGRGTFLCRRLTVRGTCTEFSLWRSYGNSSSGVNRWNVKLQEEVDYEAALKARRLAFVGDASGSS